MDSHAGEPFRAEESPLSNVARPEVRLRKIKLPSGRTLTATPVFDSYWRFACLRQEAFMRRVRKDPPPWSDDPVIAAHRFTNVYRASDRVSQFLIREVQNDAEHSAEDLFFRTMLFKLFNRISTWEQLDGSLGGVRWKAFSQARAEAVLDRLMAKHETVYSAAYIMPSPAFGAVRKHANHLRLLARMMEDNVAERVESAKKMEDVFKLLRGYPSLGDFLAFQLTIDLNYSKLTKFSEMEFVVAGPGAHDGISKCFSDVDGLTAADVIKAVAELAESEFKRLGLNFENLWGRDLQLIDCQNLFCEVGKYARIVHPEFAGESGRTRIKQRFTAEVRHLPDQMYPPKWLLSVPAQPSLVNACTKRPPVRQRSAQLTLGEGVRPE